MTYNLLDQKWIPVPYLDGKKGNRKTTPSDCFPVSRETTLFTWCGLRSEERLTPSDSVCAISLCLGSKMSIPQGASYGNLK